tara:strand:- start:43 stop:903 length:861 start_codon:yes stop_codon:yes gene_type:complete
MIKSMTGFGRGTAGRGKNKIEIEIRSLNSRFLDVKYKGLVLDATLENEIKKILSDRLHRGSIQIRFNINQNYEIQKLIFDKEKFDLIQQILKNIHVEYGQKMNLSDIISTNDLLKNDIEERKNEKYILKAVSVALDQLQVMRKKEGELIFSDINGRIKKINNAIKIAEKKSNQFKDEKREKIHSNLSKLLDEKSIDESRLIQEVAYFSERFDVTEEIVRTRSHFDQIKTYLESEEPIGKKINFLIQEIGREINTIGAKSQQTDVTRLVVDVKDELEKIREQIQNIL